MTDTIENEDETKTKYIVAVGDPEGFCYIGPFENWSDVEEWIEWGNGKRLEGENWFQIKLISPDKF